MTAANNFRTGTSVRYEIEVIQYGIWNTDEQAREGMDGIRLLCVDLIEGIDQSMLERGESYGEDGMLHTKLFVEPGSVGEAVRRINKCGFATDEDESEDEEGLELYDEGLE